MHNSIKAFKMKINKKSFEKDLNGGCGCLLRALVCSFDGGDDFEVVHAHELAVDLRHGRQLAGLLVDVEEVLRSRVDQRRHAVSHIRRCRFSLDGKKVFSNIFSFSDEGLVERKGKRYVGGRLVAADTL